MECDIPSVLTYDGKRREPELWQGATPPNMKARYRIANTIPNNSDTRINVPRDCVSVVMMIDFPDFFSWSQTSSVPSRSNCTSPVHE